MKKIFIVLLLFERLFACAQNSVIQYYTPNPGVQKAFVLYDNDSLIPTYELPNPLVLESGQKWWTLLCGGDKGALNYCHCLRMRYMVRLHFFRRQPPVFCNIQLFVF